MDKGGIMDIFAPFRRIEKQYALTFFAFTLAIILGGVAIYTAFFMDRNPHLRFTLNSLLGVYSIREEIDKLEIIYDGMNIREQNQMLSVMSFTVMNTGRQHITTMMYDYRSLLGFKLDGGSILKAEIIDATKSYLLKNISISFSDKQTVNFWPIIIDSGESFTIKILILHGSSETPQITPLGKIAGVKEIELIPLPVEESEMTFTQQLLTGKLLLKPVKVLGIIFAAAFIILIGGVIMGFISSKLEEQKNSKHVRDFKSVSDISLNAQDDFIFETYISYSAMFTRINQLMSSPKKFERYIYRFLEYQKNKDQYKAKIKMGFFHPYAVIGRLIKSGFLVKNEDEITINPHMENTFKQFVKFLEGRGVTFAGGLNVIKNEIRRRNSEPGDELLEQLELEELSSQTAKS
jgi:hypothetical protein